MRNMKNIRKKIVSFLGGNLNVFFNSRLEMKGDQPSLKQKSVAKLLEMTEKYDLYNIWRIRNLTGKTMYF